MSIVVSKVTLNLNRIEQFYCRECNRFLGVETYAEAYKKAKEIIEEKPGYSEFYDVLIGKHYQEFINIVGERAGYKRTTNLKGSCGIRNLFILYLYVFEKCHNFKFKYNMQEDNFRHFLELVEAV